LRAAGIPVARLLALPPNLIARILPMPDWMFRLIAERVASVDPHARSSMSDDFATGRQTEIDYLQGEVVRLAEKLGRAAPINAALVRLVHAAEAGGKRDFSGVELRRAIGG
jgi:2-dehydropantoate 2-reductase